MQDIEMATDGYEEAAAQNVDEVGWSGSWFPKAKDRGAP